MKRKDKVGFRRRENAWLTEQPTQHSGGHTAEGAQRPSAGSPCGSAAAHLSVSLRVPWDPQPQPRTERECKCFLLRACGSFTRDLGDPVPSVYLRSGVLCVPLWSGLGLAMEEPASVTFCFHTGGLLDTAFESREGTVLGVVCRRRWPRGPGALEVLGPGRCLHPSFPLPSPWVGCWGCFCSSPLAFTKVRFHTQVFIGDLSCLKQGLLLRKPRKDQEEHGGGLVGPMS